MDLRRDFTECDRPVGGYGAAWRRVSLPPISSGGGQVVDHMIEQLKVTWPPLPITGATMYSVVSWLILTIGIDLRHGGIVHNGPI